MLLGYGAFGIVKQVRAARAARDPLKHHTLRIVARVGIIRWLANACVFIAAIAIDLTDEENTRADMHTMLALLLSAATIAVVAELVGHRLVRRYMEVAADDPGPPAAPVLHLHRADKEEDPDDGPR